MSKYILENGEEITIKHIMADGTERDSIEGYEVPVNENTKIVYHLLAEWIKRKNLK